MAAFHETRADKLVSIMMITAQGPADSLLAEWEATWVEPEHRGSGIAKRAYAEVHRITKELGYQHAIVFIREDNHHSRGIRVAQGFTYLRTKEAEHWADGSVANADLSVLDLDADCPSGGHRIDCAIRRLEVTLRSLRGEAAFVGEALRARIAELRSQMPRSRFAKSA